MAGSSDKAAALEKRHFRNIRATYTASHSDATQSLITRLLSPTWDVILNMKNLTVADLNMKSLTNARYYLPQPAGTAHAADGLGA